MDLSIYINRKSRLIGLSLPNVINGSEDNKDNSNFIIKYFINKLISRNNNNKNNK